MAGSILKEKSFTPQIFDPSFFSSNSRRYRKLFSLLEGMLHNGIVILPSASWRNAVVNYLQDDIVRHSGHGSDIKDLEDIIEELDKRNRFSFPDVKRLIGDEDEWINEISKLDATRSLDLIVSSVETKISQSIENIREEEPGGIITENQSIDFMRKMLAPVLSDADIVKVIDPYFNLDVDRYKSSFEMICELLGNRRWGRKKSLLEIHTFKNAFNDKIDDGLLRKIQYRLKNAETYNHDVSIYIWGEKDNKKHDRCIITNQCGVYVGKGMDEGINRDSTWGILNWKEKGKIENMFERNRGYYDFIASVNIDEIIFETIDEKNQKWLNKQEEIRKEKLANRKDLKRNK